MILPLKLCKVLVLGLKKLISVSIIPDLLLMFSYQLMDFIFNSFPRFLWILIKQ